MSEAPGKARTGVAWSPFFGAHPGGPGAAFLPPHDFLPDERWDRGARVQCLRDILSYASASLPSLHVIEEFAPATVDELLEFHTKSYVDAAIECPTEQLHAALLAVGAVRALCAEVWGGRLRNAYALVRPAGHHSGPDTPGGGCLFANGVLAALAARSLGARRILFVDWDAHHGNSQQDAFWDDPSVLTISVHQDRAYPPGTGGVDARGAGAGYGTNINVPVPMGSGGGVYRAVFTRVIAEAAARFRPDLVLVASGLDANYLDPSARLALHSADYGWMTDRMVGIADEHADGRLILTHEGGYALPYLPLCLLRVVESLTGDRTGVPDPFLDRWGTDFAAAVPGEAATVIRECARQATEVPSVA